MIIECEVCYCKWNNETVEECPKCRMNFLGKMIKRNPYKSKYKIKQKKIKEIYENPDNT